MMWQEMRIKKKCKRMQLKNVEDVCVEKEEA